MTADKDATTHELAEGGEPGTQPAGLIGRAELERAYEVAEKIRELTIRTELLYIFTVGEMVLTHFFDGDAEAMRARGRKQESIRRVVEHLESWGVMSLATLNRCLNGYLLLRELGEFREWRFVGRGHVYALLPLRDRDPDEIRDLIERCEAEEWTVRRLREHVAELRSVATARSAATADPGVEFKRQLNTVWTQTIDLKQRRDVSRALPYLDEDDRYELMSKVMDLRDYLDGLMPLLSPKSIGE